MQYSGDQHPSLQELVDSGQLPPEVLEADVTFEKVEEDVIGGEVKVEKKKRGWFGSKTKKKDQVVPHSPPPTQQQVAFQQTVGKTEVCCVLVPSYTVSCRIVCKCMQVREGSVCLSVCLSVCPQVQQKRQVTVEYSGDQPPSLQELVDSGQLPPEALGADVTFKKV